MAFANRNHDKHNTRRGKHVRRAGNIVPLVFNTASVQSGRAAKLAAIRRPVKPEPPITTQEAVTES